MARAAQSNLDPLPEESDARRKAILVGAGAAVALGVIVLGFKLFGSKGESAPHAAAPVVQAPQYPQEVTDLVARIETSLKGDDFKGARADVDQLRQLAPSHPRLAFFENLLAERNDKSKVASSDSPRGRKRGIRTSQSESAGTADQTTNTSNASGTSEALSKSATKPGPGGTPAVTDSGPLPPETPVGMTIARSESADAGAHAQSPPATAPTAEVATQTPSSGAVASTAIPAPAVAASAGTSSAPVSPPAAAPPAPRRANSDEPPPVIREAKLIHRVNPDYPSAAKHDGIVGSVDLDVTVSQQGTVKDVSVSHAQPPDLFDKAAVAAVRKWKYNPRFVDGLPEEAQLKVHLEFKPGQ